jgi:hypothetical protein
MTRITDTRTDALRLAQRALLIGAALVIVISTLRLFADVGRPFDGMITYHNVIIGEYFFSEATPSWWLTRRWDLIPPLEELYTVNGRPYSDAPQVFAEVWTRGEDQVMIEYDDAGERLSARVPLAPFSVDQFIDLRAPTLIIAIALLLTGLLLHTTSFASPQRNSLFFCVVCAAFGFGIDQPSLFWLEDDLARALDVISALFTVLTSVALVLVARSYMPSQGWLGRVWQIIGWGAWLWAGLAFYLAVRARWLLFNEGITPLTQLTDSMAFYSRTQFFSAAGLLLTFTLIGIIVVGWRRRHTSPSARASVRSAMALLAGLLLAQPSTTANMLNRVFGQQLDLFLGAFDLRFMLLFIPLFSTAAIVRHGAFRIQSPLMILVILILTSALAASAFNAMSMAGYLMAIDGKLLVGVPSIFLPAFLFSFALSSFWAFQNQISGWMSRWFLRSEVNLRHIDDFFRDFMPDANRAVTYTGLIDALCRHFRLDYAGLWLFDPDAERRLRLPFTRRAQLAHRDVPDVPDIRLTRAEVDELCALPYLPIDPSDSLLPSALRDLAGNPLMEALIPLVVPDARNDGQHGLLGFLIVSRRQDMDVLYEDDMRAFSHVARELTQHLLRSRHEAHIARTNVLLHNEIMARISTIRREMQEATPQRLIDQQAIWLSDLDDSLHILRDIQSGRLSRERLKDLAAKVNQFDERHPHLKIEHHIDDMLRLPGQLQADIVQWVTEALNNAARHSGATRITLTLAYQPDLRMVRLVVQDNGTGTAPEASGSGLRAIADGVAVWRGTFTLANPHYGGTCVTIDLPYAQPVSKPGEPPAPARAG